MLFAKKLTFLAAISMTLALSANAQEATAGHSDRSSADHH